MWHGVASVWLTLPQRCGPFCKMESFQVQRSLNKFPAAQHLYIAPKIRRWKRKRMIWKRCQCQISCGFESRKRTMTYVFCVFFPSMDGSCPYVRIQEGLFFAFLLAGENLNLPPSKKSDSILSGKEHPCLLFLLPRNHSNWTSLWWDVGQNADGVNGYCLSGGRKWLKMWCWDRWNQIDVGFGSNYFGWVSWKSVCLD